MPITKPTSSLALVPYRASDAYKKIERVVARIEKPVNYCLCGPFIIAGATVMLIIWCKSLEDREAESGEGSGSTQNHSSDADSWCCVRRNRHNSYVDGYLDGADDANAYHNGYYDGMLVGQGQPIENREAQAYSRCPRFKEVIHVSGTLMHCVGLGLLTYKAATVIVPAFIEAYNPKTYDPEATFAAASTLVKCAMIAPIGSFLRWLTPQAQHQHAD